MFGVIHTCLIHVCKLLFTLPLSDVHKVYHHYSLICLSRKKGGGMVWGFVVIAYIKFYDIFATFKMK